MFKAMILLKRKAESNHAEFSQWWLNQHKPLAEQLPGVKAVVINLSEETSADEYNGISEL